MDKKYQIVINDIKDKIARNIYSPRNALPKETELVKQYGFSRVTVQKAMKELVREGLIYRVAGRGTFIKAVEIEPMDKPPNFFIVIPYRDNEMFKLVYGIEAEMIKNKYLFSFFFINKLDKGNTSLTEDYDAFIYYISRLNPQGVFCYPPNSADGYRGYKEILNKKIPLIILDKEFAKCPVNSVVSDNYSGMYELTRYVIDKGHKNIGYLSYDTSLGDTIVKRKNGFIDCLKDNNISFNQSYIKDYARRFDQVKVILNDLLNGAPEITAIICSNDSIAERCYPELKNRNLSIPEDISICSFDGYEAGQKLNPRLTVMKQDLYEIGRNAAQSMIDMYQKINNGIEISYSFKHIIPTVFIENESVKRI